MDLATFRWLLTPDGQQLLLTAAQAYADADGDPVRAAAQVRKADPDPDRSAAALTQVELRVKAVPKFGDEALRLYFTPDALEQATRRRVADHRAARVAAAEPGSVIDLGCGIGADLMAFARAGLTAAGVELDPVRAAIAEANLAALGLPGAVAVAEATTVDVSGFGVAFADPARRTGRGRSFDAADWSPPWSWVEQLLHGRAVVKAAPGIPHDLIPDGVEAEWVSELGEVKEAVLWSPYLTTTRRRATVLGHTGLATLTDEDDPYDGRERPVRDLGGYLYEPDGAVIRAGLVTAVAAGVDGGLRRRAHRLRHLRRLLPHALRPRLPGRRARCPTARSSSGRLSSSAASARSPSRSAASTSTPRRCASGCTSPERTRRRWC